MNKKSGQLGFYMLLGGILVAAFYMSNRAVGLFLAQKGSVLEKLSALNFIFADIEKNPFYLDIHKESLFISFMVLLIFLAIFLYTIFDRKNYMPGEEHGSATWGTAKDMSKYKDKNPKNNMLLTMTESMSLNTRQTFRNNNTLVIGGAGSGKTRFFVKPNLMQLHTSYVITDPKGALLTETGKMFKDAGYEIKVFNLIEMYKSDKYNFFHYINDEKDILKLVNNLITNTNAPQSKNSGDFWEKAETALLQALFAYVVFEGLPTEKNIHTVMELLRAAEVREEDETFQSPLDLMFEDLEKENSEHFAVKQYKLFKLAAGKTAKSILVSVGVRLSPFNIKIVNELLSDDELELDAIGDRLTALFVIIPDTDKTFNFIAAMMYQQMFDMLVLKADKSEKKRLNYHVRCMLDEFANIGRIPDFEVLISTMRSREISVNIILQTLSQLKSSYKDDVWEIIVGNCDSVLFLGGKEQSTLKFISEMIGKTTVDIRTTSENKGQSSGFTIGSQVVGRELITPAEVGLLKSTECIFSLRGVNPFRSIKFDITKHKRYRELSDFDSKNTYVYKKKRDSKEFLDKHFFDDITSMQEIEALLS